MKESSIQISFRWLQILLWTIFFLAWALYTNNKWNSATYGFASTIISIVFYIIAVYTNCLWLMPRFFRKGNIGRYIVYSIVFILLLVLIRAWIERIVLIPLHRAFYDMGLPHLSLVFLTTLIAFLFGSLLFVARNYIGLLQKQEEMKSQQLVTELALLKQQVQPHFLFNTLNNIYSLAHAKSDNTKIAIAKLADIMRYFMEDAPREKVALQTELDFIRNYISLEQLRMLHPVEFSMDLANEHREVPTMLLMPFVENLFKHGVDKTRNDNVAFLELKLENDRLKFTVRNKVYPDAATVNGFGLSNLKKRLDLLYGTDYTLRTGKNGLFFEAYMEIPV
jgi:sensor histidine kinase YesM